MAFKMNNDRKPIKGVIFDLDGTLVDSYEAIYLGFQYTYAKMGLKPLSYDEVKNHVGHSLQHIFRELLRDRDSELLPARPNGHSGGGEQNIQQAITLFRQKYSEVFLTHTRFLPDANEVIKALHHKGVKLSVATNKLGRFSRSILEHLQVSTFFSAIIGEGDVTRNKPDPEMLYLAIEKMGLLQPEAIMVGDSEIDIQSALNAPIRVYAVPSGTTSKEALAKHNPTAVLDRLSDLLDYA